MQVAAPWITTYHRRNIRNAIDSLATSSKLGEISVRVVGTAADAACRALSDAVDARVIRRLYDVVVLLELQYLRLQPSSLVLMILISELQILVSLLYLVQLARHLLKKRAKLLALVESALQLLDQVVSLLFQLLNDG